jgi:hypothetical protein
MGMESCDKGKDGDRRNIEGIYMVGRKSAVVMPYYFNILYFLNIL